jgi:hypothetical protein
MLARGKGGTGLGERCDKCNMFKLLFEKQFWYGPFVSALVEASPKVSGRFTAISF